MYNFIVQIYKIVIKEILQTYVKMEACGLWMCALDQIIINKCANWKWRYCQRYNHTLRSYVQPHYLHEQEENICGHTCPQLLVIGSFIMVNTNLHNLNEVKYIISICIKVRCKCFGEIVVVLTTRPLIILVHVHVQKEYLSYFLPCQLA